MLVKKLKARIGEDKKLLIHVTDIPPGEVEIIILKKEEGCITRNEILSKLPRHRAGKILKSLHRGDIYTGAR
jgi:hypothetical protein